MCPMSPNPQTTQKPTTVPPHISVNNGRMGMLQIPVLCACTVGTHMSHMNKRFVHLGGGDLGRMANLRLVDKRGKELVELKLQVLA
jgi:hypothetical protein